jgi:hypothetical protein
LLQQDNSRPHTSEVTTDAIVNVRFTLLPHPAYNLDITPRDFYLFPKLKEDLWGQNFSSDEAVKAAIHWWFWEKEKYFFKNGIQTLVTCWQKCIEVGEDCVEK